MQYPCEMDIQFCTNENASVYWDCQIFTLALLGCLLGNNFWKLNNDINAKYLVNYFCLELAIINSFDHQCDM